MPGDSWPSALLAAVSNELVLADFWKPSPAFLALPDALFVLAKT